MIRIPQHAVSLLALVVCFAAAPADAQRPAPPAPPDAAKAPPPDAPGAPGGGTSEATPPAGQQATPEAEDPARVEAKRHFKQGVAFFKDGDFGAALVEFQASYQAYPYPQTLKNIGLTHQELHQYPEAIAAFIRYLESKDPELTPELAAEIRGFIAEMRALLVEVKLTIKPDEAAVVVDGRSIGKAPLDPLQLTAGRHVVEVSAADYEPLRREIVVIAGEPVALMLSLKEIPRTGHVRVLTSVRRASIFIDGQLVGSGTAEVDLSAGGHTLEVSAPGYRTQKSELAIATGQRRTLNVQLEAPFWRGLLYRRWWLWTAVGVVAGGTTAAIAAPLNARREPPLVDFPFGAAGVP